MTFEEILDQAIAMLQRRGRVTYQTLRLQFQLDEEHLEALKDAILFAYRRLLMRQAAAWSGVVRLAPSRHQHPPPLIRGATCHTSFPRRTTRRTTRTATP